MRAYQVSALAALLGMIASLFAVLAENYQRAIPFAINGVTCAVLAVAYATADRSRP
jgi:threonyl-tRNA synthetase